MESIGSNSPSQIPKLVQNIISAAASHVASTLIVLAITPLLLHKLGLEAYGVWAFISAIAKYGLVAEFGLGPSITRFVAEYHSKSEIGNVKQTVTFGILFYLAVGSIIVPTFFFLSPLIFAHLKLSAPLKLVAPGVATGFITWLLLDLAASVLRALLAGLGHLGTASKAIALGQVAFAAFAVIFTQIGLGLYGMLDALWIQLLVSVVLLSLAARQELGERVLCSPFSLRASVIKPLFAVSSWIQLSTLMSIIYNESGQLIVGIFVSVATSGLYDMGTKLASAVRAVSSYFCSGLLPVIARLDSQQGGQSAAVAFIRSSRYQAIFTFFATGLLVGASPAFLHLWLGARVNHLPIIIQVMTVLCPVYLIDSIITVAITTLRAIGKPKLETAYSVVAASFHVGLTIFLAPRFGLTGILAGLMIGTIVASCNFLYFFARTQSANIWGMMRGWLTRLIVILLASTGTIAWLEAHVFDQLMTSQIGIVFSVAALTTVYALLFGLGLKFSGFFGHEDSEIAGKILPKRFADIFINSFVARSKSVDMQ